MDRSDAYSGRREIGETAAVGTRRSLLAGVGGLALAAATRSSLAEALPRNDQTGRKKKMDIKRNGSWPSGKGPEAWFTGTVRVDPLFQAGDPARISGGQVTFEPGARTMWHTHPLGQTLIVTSGLGWVQCENGPVEEIRPGDVIWFPAGEKHWHGATATTAMTHIAITESLNGKNVDWMEKVSDEQYRS
jgi:quercetin dioxygenase-like cupin family protein